ncbi:MAG: hypothetical protein V1495_06745 [Pseudomonadota bacterium]
MSLGPPFQNSTRQSDGGCNSIPRREMKHAGPIHFAKDVDFQKERLEF